MSLKKYAEKRHFDRTPEPAPGKPPHGHARIRRCNFASSAIMRRICITISGWKSTAR